MPDYFFSSAKTLPDDLFQLFNLSGEFVCLFVFKANMSDNFFFFFLPRFRPGGSLMTGTSLARAIPGYRGDEETALTKRGNHLSPVWTFLLKGRPEASNN